MRVLTCTVTVAALTGAARAQVASLGDLTAGTAAIGNINGGTIEVVDASFWDFWTFRANVGDFIDIEVDRLLSGLDPASSVVYGDATGLPFASLTGADIFDWSGPGLSLSPMSFGDDEDPPATGSGPFGDPHYNFIAPFAGIYTVAVASYKSDKPFPPDGYPYSITVTGSTVPAPGALTLLACAGLLTARRRRAWAS